MIATQSTGLLHRIPFIGNATAGFYRSSINPLSKGLWLTGVYQGILGAGAEVAGPGLKKTALQYVVSGITVIGGTAFVSFVGPFVAMANITSVAVPVCSAFNLCVHVYNTIDNTATCVRYPLDILLVGEPCKPTGFSPLASGMVSIANITKIP